MMPAGESADVTSADVPASHVTATPSVAATAVTCPRSRTHGQHQTQKPREDPTTVRQHGSSPFVLQNLVAMKRFTRSELAEQIGRFATVRRREEDAARPLEVKQHGLRTARKNSRAPSPSPLPKAG
jgi:hypothetical protein